MPKTQESAGGEVMPAKRPDLSSMILQAVDELGRFEARLKFFLIGVEAICQENIDDVHDWGFLIEASSDLKQFFAETEALVQDVHEAAKKEWAA